MYQDCTQCKRLSWKSEEVGVLVSMKLSWELMEAVCKTSGTSEVVWTRTLPRTARRVWGTDPKWSSDCLSVQIHIKTTFAKFVQ